MLACAPSNIAVDNIIERLHAADPRLKIVRIGHPARLLESVQQFCLDALIQSSGNARASYDMRKEMHKLTLKLSKAKTKTEKYDIFTEFKQMRKDLRQMESALINQVLASANVICCTLTSAADKTLRKYIHTEL